MMTAYRRTEKQMRNRVFLSDGCAKGARGERAMDALIALAGGAVLLGIAAFVALRHDTTEFINKNFKGGYLLSVTALSALVLIVLAAALWLLRRGVGRRRQSGPLRAAHLAASFFALLTLQLFIGFHTYAMQSGDMRQVLQTAFSLARGETQYIEPWYFEVYPNNLPITVLFSSIFRLWMTLTGTEPGIERFAMLLMAVQCLLSALTGVLYMVLAEKLTGRRSAAFLMLAGYAGLIALSGWITVPYSDPAVLVFPVLTALLDLRSRECGSAGGRQCWAALAGAAGGMGMMIKPQSAMVLCAVLFCEALGWLLSGARRNRGSVMRFAAVLCAFLMMAGPVRSALCGMSGIDDRSEKRVSMLHYLYMGMNEMMCGGYYEPDYISVEEAPTYRERQALYIQAIGERARRMGPERMLAHLERKLLVAFSDGTFSWGINGHDTPALKDERITPLLRSIFWEDGRYNIVLSTAQQALWLAVLMLCPFAGLAVRRERERGRRAAGDEINVLIVSALGQTAFSLLFEAGGRYLLCMAPVFMLLAVCAFAVLIGERKAYKG